MVGRKYPWIVLSSCLMSAIFLLIAEARFSALAAERGWHFGSAWILWAIAPGALCATFWLFQRRDWLQLAGLISTVGGLIYSVLFLLFALDTKEVNGHSLIPFGATHLALVIVWSVLALPIGWFGGEVRRGKTEHRRRDLTPRWSGRVIDKVPSSNVGVRAAQLNR
jgi:peptidoglycan/LPS O-acetylase OafA/YrhL